MLDLCDKVLGIASSRQHDFDFSVDGYFDDFKIGVAHCEKQNTDSVKYFSKLNIQLIEICYTDFNCEKQNNILRNTAFDQKIVRKNLISIS